MVVKGGQIGRGCGGDETACVFSREGRASEEKKKGRERREGGKEVLKDTTYALHGGLELVTLQMKVE